MKKIIRSFRLPADLVERFDQAAATAEVDKTTVVESAIVEFCERVEMGEKPLYRTEVKKAKDISKFEHSDRVEYYSKSLFDIAEVIDETERDNFIENGKAKYDEVVEVYGVKEFIVTVYDSGTVTGELVTYSENSHEFYRKNKDEPAD